MIREEQPPRPSLRISTTADQAIARHRKLDVESLTRRLRGDLDWIVMKAMEKERGRRYPTASALAEDVRRHLRREPVEAGPPGAGYRMRKFLARNRAAVLSGALVLLVLVGGIIATSLAMVQSNRNARLAGAQAEHAIAALDFLVSTLSLANPEVALEPDVTVRTLLDHTADGVATAFADQPWAEARLRAAIGRAYTALSEHVLAEPHLRRAVELFEAMDAEGEAFGPAARYDRGELYAILWTLTNVAFSLERPDAFVVSQRARQVGLAHVGASHPQLGDLLMRFTRAVEAGAWSLEADALDGVSELFTASVASADAALEPGDPLWPIVADTFLAAGYMVWYTPHEPMSESFFRVALRIQRRELPPDHPDIATGVGLLVGILNNVGKAAEAETLIRDSIAALRRVLPAGSLAIVVSESTLGENLMRQGRYAEAQPLLHRSHDSLVERIGNESNFMVYESTIRLVNLYNEWERWEEGAVYRDSLARTCAYGRHIQGWSVTRPIFGPDDAALVKRLDEAAAMVGGISYLARPGTRDAPGLDSVVADIAAIRAGTIPDDDLRSIAIGRILIGWANALDPATSVAARRRMAAVALPLVPADDANDGLRANRAECLAILASVAHADGHENEARARALEALALVQRRSEDRMWFAAAVEVRVAIPLIELGLDGEAESLLRPAHRIFAQQLGPDHADTVFARQLLKAAGTGDPDTSR